MGVFFALSEVFQGKRKDICWGSRLVHVHHVKLKIVNLWQEISTLQFTLQITSYVTFSCHKTSQLFFHLYNRIILLISLKRAED